MSSEKMNSEIIVFYNYCDDYLGHIEYYIYDMHKGCYLKEVDRNYIKENKDKIKKVSVYNGYLSLIYQIEHFNNVMFEIKRRNNKKIIRKIHDEPIIKLDEIKQENNFETNFKNYINKYDNNINKTVNHINHIEKIENELNRMKERLRKLEEHKYITNNEPKIKSNKKILPKKSNENYEPYYPNDEEDIEKMKEDDYYYDYDKKCYMIRKKLYKHLWRCSNEIEECDEFYFIKENDLMIEIEENQFKEIMNDKNYRIFSNSCDISNLYTFCENSKIKLLMKQ